MNPNSNNRLHLLSKPSHGSKVPIQIANPGGVSQHEMPFLTGLLQSPQNSYTDSNCNNNSSSSTSSIHLERMNPVGSLDNDSHSMMVSRIVTTTNCQTRSLSNTHQPSAFYRNIQTNNFNQRTQQHGGVRISAGRLPSRIDASRSSRNTYSPVNRNTHLNVANNQSSSSGVNYRGASSNSPDSMFNHQLSYHHPQGGQSMQQLEQSILQSNLLPFHSSNSSVNNLAINNNLASRKPNNIIVVQNKHRSNKVSSENSFPGLSQALPLSYENEHLSTLLNPSSDFSLLVPVTSSSAQSRLSPNDSMMLHQTMLQSHYQASPESDTNHLLSSYCDPQSGVHNIDFQELGHSENLHHMNSSQQNLAIHQANLSRHLSGKPAATLCLSDQEQSYLSNHRELDESFDFVDCTFSPERPELPNDSIVSDRSNITNKIPSHNNPIHLEKRRPPLPPPPTRENIAFDFDLSDRNHILSASSRCDRALGMTSVKSNQSTTSISSTIHTKQEPPSTPKSANSTHSSIATSSSGHSKAATSKTAASADSNLPQPPVLNMRYKNVLNFPKYKHRKNSSFERRLKRNGLTLNSKAAMSMVRKLLQHYVNKEVESVLDKYLTTYFDPVVSNIRYNLGDEALTSMDVEKLRSRIMRRVFKPYLIPALEDSSDMSSDDERHDNQQFGPSSAWAYLANSIRQVANNESHTASDKVDPDLDADDSIMSQMPRFSPSEVDPLLRKLNSRRNTPSPLLSTSLLGSALYPEESDTESGHHSIADSSVSDSQTRSKNTPTRRRRKRRNMSSSKTSSNVGSGRTSPQNGFFPSDFRTNETQNLSLDSEPAYKRKFRGITNCSGNVDIDLFSTQTEFTISVRALELLGENNLDLLFSRHPSLFRYQCDEEDCIWLVNSGNVDELSTSYRSIWLLLYQEILALCPPNRMNGCHCLTLPQTIVNKMKNSFNGNLLSKKRFIGSFTNYLDDPDLANQSPNLSSSGVSPQLPFSNLDDDDYPPMTAIPTDAENCFFNEQLDLLSSPQPDYSSMMAGVTSQAEDFLSPNEMNTPPASSHSLPKSYDHPVHLVAADHNLPPTSPLPPRLNRFDNSP